jgi:hypothetical protein
MPRTRNNARQHYGAANRINNINNEPMGVNAEAPIPPFNNYNPLVFPQVQLQPLLPPIQKFNGSESEAFECWLDDFESKTFYVDEASKRRLLRLNLGERARLVIDSCLPAEIDTYRKMVEKLKETLMDTNPFYWVNVLNEMKKEPNEEYKFYGFRVSKIVNKAYGDVPGAAFNRLKIDYFLRGLDSNLSAKISRRKPQTLQDAVEKAELYGIEVNLNIKKRKIDETTLVLGSSSNDQFSSNLSKRDEYGQNITLSTIIQQVNNNNNQLIQQIKSLKEEVKKSKNDQMNK